MSLIVGLWGLSSCMPTFDDDPSRIESERVIAIRSEPAEAEPGQLVSLSLLTVGSKTGDSTEPSWNFCTARKPLTELGPVAAECLTAVGEESDVLSPLGEGQNVSATLDRDVCRNFGPLSPSGMGSDTVGRPADPDLSGGYYQPIVVASVDPENDATESVLGTVRLLCGGAHLSQEQLVEFNKSYRPNENPETKRGIVTIDEVEQELDWSGDTPTLEVKKGARVSIGIEWEECPEESLCGDGLCTVGENATSCSEDCREAPVGCKGAETYLVPDPETRTVQEHVERVEVSWFATDGSFDSAITDNAEQVSETNNAWVAPDVSGTVQIWTVVRDSRRGVSWRAFNFRVID